MREVEWGDHKKFPPVHRWGVEARAVVQRKGEKGGGKTDGDREFI